MHKSTKDIPLKFVDMDGVGRYGQLDLSFTKTEAVGLVSKFMMTKGMQYAPHGHSDWLVVMVISGKLKVSQRNDTEECIYNPGDIYLVEPGDVHTETALEDTVVAIISGPNYKGDVEKAVLRAVDV